MRKPNTVCCICKKPIYRRPQDMKEFPKGYCKKHKIIGICYASKQRHEKDYLKYIDRWKRGLESGMRGKTAISSHIRRYLFEKYNNACSKCDWSKINKYTKKIPLEIAHKDGNFRNNKENNLELLCPNCHSLTSHYKSRNWGRGRPGRKRRI